MKDKRKIITISITIISIIILLIGTSFAWFTLVVRGEKTITISSGELSLIIKNEANAINLEGVGPTTEEKGLESSPYEFEIENTSYLPVNYQVRVVPDKEKEEECKRNNNDQECKIIPSTSIRYKVEVDGKTKESNILGSNDNIIDEGSLLSLDSASYKLWLWIDLDAGNEAQDAYYFGKIEVEVIQNMDSNLTPDDCFIFDSATNTITDYLCYSGNDQGFDTITDVVIPAYIDGTEVKTIGYLAFYNNGLTSVVMPNSLTKIDTCGFEKNLLTSISIPNSVTSIGGSAFKTNKLTSLIIPSSVKIIGGSAFWDNDISDLVLNEGLETIESYAFIRNELEIVTIPSTVISMGTESFGKSSTSNSNLTSIVNKTNRSFLFGNITAGTDTTTSFVTGVVSHSTKDVIVIAPTPDDCFVFDSATNTITDYLCYSGNDQGFDTITDVVIPAYIDGTEVKTIGYLAFYNNGLTSVVMPNSLTKIDTCGFELNSISFLVIPNSVTSIGGTAFRDNKLTTLTIPSSVKTIGGNAFWNNDISDLVLNEGLETIGTYVFIGNDLKEITIPSTVISMGTECFGKSSTNNPNLTKIINKTNRSFAWGNILKGTDTTTSFVTGTVIHANGNVEIVAN